MKEIENIRMLIESEKEWGIEEPFCLCSEPVGADLDDEAVPSELDSLRKEALSCTACGLHKTRKNVVFGEGSAYAELMFVGEAPGRDEDIQGRPFVGRAGMLLTRLINKMGFERDEVYIANVLKCRPPNNRNPLPDEIVSCRHFLRRQIELIRPKVICALGKFAAQLLLESNTPISKLRGKEFDYMGAKLIPTYHPAYLLRNPRDKIVVWEDAKKILALLGRLIPE